DYKELDFLFEMAAKTGIPGLTQRQYGLSLAHLQSLRSIAIRRHDILSEQQDTEEKRKEAEILAEQIQVAERKMQALEDSIGPALSKTTLTIQATVTNTGRSPTSIKRPALLRIILKPNNYGDVPVLLSVGKYQETDSPEIPARGTRVMVFESDD